MKIYPCPLHTVAYWPDCRDCKLPTEKCIHFQSIFRGAISERFDKEARQRYLEWYFDTPERKTHSFFDWLMANRGLQLLWGESIVELPIGEYEEVKGNYAKSEARRMKEQRDSARGMVLEFIEGRTHDYGGETVRAGGVYEGVILVDLRSPQKRRRQKLSGDLPFLRRKLTRRANVVSKSALPKRKVRRRGKTKEGGSERDQET